MTENQCTELTLDELDEYERWVLYLTLFNRSSLMQLHEVVIDKVQSVQSTSQILNYYIYSKHA